MSTTLAAYLALLAALGLVEVWTLKAIAQEFARQIGRKRVRTERREVRTARRLGRVGGMGDR